MNTPVDIQFQLANVLTAMAVFLVSSGECAVTDTLLAGWFFMGAPSVIKIVRRRSASVSS